MDSCFVYHIVEQTLRLLLQRRQLCELTECLDILPNNVPMHQQMHHRLPMNIEIKKKMMIKYCRFLKMVQNVLTVVSKTSSIRGAWTIIGLGSSASANIAPSAPIVMITVLQPKQRKLLSARFASLQ